MTVLIQKEAAALNALGNHCLETMSRDLPGRLRRQGATREGV
jgi:hypothetical protein